MRSIKFSHRYAKMPDDLTKPTTLMHVFKENSNYFFEYFKIYDSLYYEGDAPKRFPLPTGDVLVLLLHTGDTVWTTIRRWTPQKEAYYQENVGNDFEIIVEEEHGKV